MADEPKSKLFIDEDWKSQVQAEKEAAKSKPAEGAGDVQAQADQAAGPEHGQLPEPSLPFLFTTLATEAMVSLGAIENPLTGKQELNLPHAKHFIDTLQLLEAKTEGNRTPEETSLLKGLLHQLRMDYVQAKR